MSNDIDDLFDCFELNEDPASVTSNVSAADNSQKKLPTNLKRQHNENGAPNDDDANDTSSKRPRMELEQLAADEINFDEFNNRIVVHKLEAVDSCCHEVACPPSLTYVPLVSRNGPPAKSYPFKLDPFQEESILCIDNNQSVLVSAHTSAGKTVVAEYAIAMSFQKKQRVIYTTPIKALSNQKYREFYTEFKDVGLVTGDVTINPTATCLIMTTEILRNMLYRGSEIMREVGWVIFDEIHYMRDKERGVVWEETIILLPRNSHFVFLSATIPNARQFVEWVAHLHQQPCHVVYTDYRPTPLQHFVFPSGGQGIYTVVDMQGDFKEDNFNTAMSVLANVGEAAKGDKKGRNMGMAGKDPTETDIYKIVKMIMERNFAPVIVFSFSKKNCELFAKQMTKLDFNTAQEKELVNEVFTNAISILSEDDRHLLQVTNILPLLQRGIGIHHGGLLPILKETIEILFGEGLLKVLFATETFAMGLNMPARTVLFTGVRKFDGREYRWLTSGEYVQMSGRAGRRGLDEKGIVIMMVDEKIPPAVGRDVIKGSPDPINSAFHLTYNMVLNLLRVEDINPEYLLERSFYQFQNQAKIPNLYENYNKKLEEFTNFKVENEEEIASYYEIMSVLETLGKRFRKFIIKPQYLLKFLQEGRLIKIKSTNDEYDWGVVINFKKVSEPKGSGRKGPNSKPEYVTKILVDILLHILPTPSEEEEGSSGGKLIPKPCPPNQTGKVEVVTVPTTMITHLSSVRLRCPSDLCSAENRNALYKTIKEVKKRFDDKVPLLKPIEDMKIDEPEFVEIVKQIETLEAKMYAHPMHKNSNLSSLYITYEKKLRVRDEYIQLKNELSSAMSILQLDELKCRKRVLRRLGYCTKEDVIEIKGRVGCELSSSDEILLTELIFNGVFGSLTPAQSCALLSCFVCDEKSQSGTNVAEELSGSLRQMQSLARNIAKISTEARLPLDEDQYLERFKPSLMDVVYAWCNGASFSKLCEMTDIFEGSIIRCMRRLEELLREMVQASKTIGNVELEDKFNSAIRLIKRDIVFASSLYL